MPPSATLVQGPERYALTRDALVVVPAGSVILEIEDVSAPAALGLDGRHPRVAWSASARRATLAIELKRDTGYHELVVGPASFVFGTEDAKLRIDGMVQLLDYLGQHGLSWSGAMFFSGTAQVLRDLRLDRAWLERTSSEIVELGSAIADRPWTVRRARRQRIDHGVPDVGATLRLLRQRRDLLEEFVGGPVEFESPDGDITTYAPQEIIVRERKRSLDTPGNRRVTALLEGTAALARSVLDFAPKDVKPMMAGLVDQLEKLLARQPFRELRRRNAHLRLGSAVAAEERLDPRYARARALHHELFAERHWDPRREVMPERAYAGYADAIFQRFCGQLLADHLGLVPTADPPGEGSGPHFVGDRFDLYLDVTPPPSVIRDWRDASDRRANLRPDLVLHETATGRTALMDAKYRNSGLRASLDSLTDVQLYLQAYARKRIGVLFPPDPGPDDQRWMVHEVTDGSFSIFEMPVLPDPRMASFLDTAIAPTIELLLDA